MEQSYFINLTFLSKFFVRRDGLRCFGKFPRGIMIIFVHF